MLSLGVSSRAFGDQLGKQVHACQDARVALPAPLRLILPALPRSPHLTSPCSALLTFCSVVYTFMTIASAPAWNASCGEDAGASFTQGQQQG